MQQVEAELPYLQGLSVRVGVKACVGVWVCGVAKGSCQKQKTTNTWP